MADRRTVLVCFPLFLLLVIPGVSSETCAPIDRDIKVLKDSQPLSCRFWNLFGNKIKYPNNVTLYTKPKNIGSYESDTKFVTERNSFTLTFGPVEVSELSFVTTIITFKCKSNATWLPSPDGNVPHPPSINYTTDGEFVKEIQYKLVFDYKGACPGGGGGGGGGDDDEPTTPLSVGSIMLIL
ncbi:hypothetical protein OS493_024524 [Desmophyllum pertusum]|uniref:Uncharacterized protein n=1 Tax=Desmophyllum pertusum TaxID=174260 RepID=A0A9X0D7Q5_9CNID|nr:hypothetical protein OS493_024524 [Desmophyllum pertusum]